MLRDIFNLVFLICALSLIVKCQWVELIFLMVAWVLCRLIAGLGRLLERRAGA